MMSALWYNAGAPTLAASQPSAVRTPHAMHAHVSVFLRLKLYLFTPSPFFAQAVDHQASEPGRARCCCWQAQRPSCHVAML